MTLSGKLRDPPNKQVSEVGEAQLNTYLFCIYYIKGSGMAGKYIRHVCGLFKSI